MSSDSLWATFAELAQRVPDVECILSPGRRPLRFRDLPARLEAVRGDLARLGIGCGDRVVSVLRRGPETAVCYLGVAACATYVPLNPDASETEFTRDFTRLRPAALIVPEGHARVARGCARVLGIPIIDLVSRVSDPAGTFSLRGAAGAGTPGPVRGWNSAEDIALVLLTSGSTAEPKAVPLRVRHLLAYARAAGEHFALTSEDRCLHVMPMFHGHGLKSSLLVPLANGSGVITSPDFDVPTFFEQLKAMRPTWYSATAAIHQAILARVDDYQDVVRSTPLRFIRAGSSRLDPTVSAALERAFAAPVVELYSMSETGNLTANPLPPGARKPGSVGRPMGNEVAVIDQSGCFLGPNQVGEVVARGPSVFDGYLDGSGDDQVAFIHGWFRTGDLGCIDDEGYLTLIGRIKDVIVRGGEKIAPAEIERVLLQHPGVTDACAFGLAHSSLGEEVAAAVSMRRPVTERELIAFARESLTSVKVPRRILIVDSLPKGPADKVRRAELAARCAELIGETRESAAGEGSIWSPLEKEIARLWTDILGIQVVDREDDFFRLGGDSLNAMELFARLNRKFRVSLRLEAMFVDAATVAGMAKAVERARLDASHSSMAAERLVVLKTAGSRAPLFVVPAKAGNSLGFAYLARLLDPRHPVVGIEPRGMNGIDRPLTRMEEIAADNITRMRRLQAQGPYFLMGNCFGGVVAYEMARQLQSSGERVGLLFMLDTPSPFVDAAGWHRGGPVKARHISRLGLLAQYAYDRVQRHSRSVRELRGADRRAFVRAKIDAAIAALGSGDIFRGDRRRLGRRAVYAANRQAGRNYITGPFNGPVVLYLSRGRRTGTQDPRLDWLRLAPRIEAPTYIGTNDRSLTLLTSPDVYELAAAVNTALEAAHANEQNSSVLAPPACASDAGSALVGNARGASL